MSQRSRVPFRIIRLKNFFLVLLKNKMAFTGLVILTVFLVLALGAPILTPYDPQGSVVAGDLAPPAWVNLINGQGWSQNAKFSNLTATSSGNGVHVTTQPNGPDSIGLSVTVDPGAAAGGRVEIMKTLHWSYKGGPSRFLGTIKITPTGLSPSVNASISVSLQRVGEFTWRDIWQQTLNSSRTYVPPYGGGVFNSNDLNLKAKFGLLDSQYDPAAVVFSKVADYAYILDIALPPGQFQASFSVQDFGMLLYGSSWGLLGTNAQGNDIFTQFAYGARISLIVGFLATFIGVGVGLVVGLLAGYIGKIVDEVLMRFTDMMLVVPGLPLLIVLVAVLGQSIWNIILILGFLGWMGFARVIRSQVLSLRERPFIEAARASGAGTGYITVRHILPNIISLTYVNLALSVPAAIVGEAALSFLGLGDSTIISWGKMLEDARMAGTSSTLLWWWTIPPGIGIALLSLSFILIGYALDELFNPRLRRRR
jgi:peptide/nickel transport system permease protein